MLSDSVSRASCVGDQGNDAVQNGMCPGIRLCSRSSYHGGEICTPYFPHFKLDDVVFQIIDDDSIPNMSQKKALFKSSAMHLDLRYVVESTVEDIPIPKVDLTTYDLQQVGHLGPSVTANLTLHEGQVVTFILRCPPKDPPIPQAIPRTETAKEYNVTFDCSLLKRLPCCC